MMKLFLITIYGIFCFGLGIIVGAGITINGKRYL